MAHFKPCEGVRNGVAVVLNDILYHSDPLFKSLDESADGFDFRRVLLISGIRFDILVTHVEWNDIQEFRHILDIYRGDFYRYSVCDNAKEQKYSPAD